jgi:hypothetical protein
MAKQVTKSGLAAKLGDKGRKAVEAHKHDETVISGGGDLPAGIDGGVAQLVECKFDVIKPGKENAGEYFFYAAGVVVQPIDFNGQRVEGGRTSIMELLCDTPTRSRKTLDEHIAWVLNEFRKLGVDTSGLTFDDFEATAAALKAAQPYFRFRTWAGEVATEGKYKGKPPLINHQWGGCLPKYQPGDDSPPDVVDETENAEEPGAAVEPGAEGEVDLASLYELAEAGDSDAQTKLTELAVAAGHAEDDVNAAPNWQAVLDMIGSGDGGGETTETSEEAEEPWVPKKGDTYRYEVKDPKNPKKAGKLTEVEVTVVDAKAETVSLKNLEDAKKTYTKVPWTALKGFE